MLSFLSAASRPGVPDWWTGDLPIGHSVELEVYGDRMTGRVQAAECDTIQIRIPMAEQVPGLLLSTASGTAVVSLPGGAARAPVSCWASGDIVRLQVVGPVQFIQRRVHARLAVRLPISLGWLRPGARSWDHARSFTVDLSIGGVRIAPATTVWPGSGIIVAVQLDLPDGPCQLTAAVLGTTADYGLRLNFTEASADAVERLNRLTT